MVASASPMGNPAPAGRLAPAGRWGSVRWLGFGLVAALAVELAMGLGARVPATSEAGYWIGVAGGIAMLLLFAYPLRKRARWLRDAGSPRWWFIAHMALGILGPWLILVHCGLRFGSLNAAVALLSMLIVAGSGVVGRFLYVRIHHGLSGQKAQLRELRAALQEHHRLDTGLTLPQPVRERLDRFEQQALADAAQAAASPWRLLGLWWPAWREWRRVRAQINAAPLPMFSTAGGVGQVQARRACRAQWRWLAQQRLRLVLRVVQFSAWERLFALWHVLHIPFVYVMVVCAIAHIVAVHAY